MSLYNEASLVMVPSAYKDQKVYSVKPFDGSGDLTFSRASNATRVNSSGLVEKVRENFILQSNTFTTTWSQNFVQPPTANAIANPLTGAVDAWKLVEDATDNFHYILQTPTFASGEVSFSFYAKSAERTTCSAFLSQGGNVGGSFNLSTGVATASGTGNTASMVSVGNGWWRCIVTNNGSAAVANQVRIGVADGALINYVGDGTSGIYIYAAQAEQGVATDYIATTSAAVSVGPVSGLPRLDYSGGASCPSLLLEPQRTNLLTFSEQLATGTGGTSPITSNTVVSPSGYQDADTVGSGYMSKGVSAASGTYTFSVFLKYESAASVLLYIYDGAYYQGSFNLQTGVATSSTGSPTVSMVSYGNGWYRCFVTATTASAISEVGFGSGSVYAYGLQLEAGAYATSYIPTLSSVVTRVADAASKTGISSLIGQTEGTMFVEAKVQFDSSLNARLLLIGSGVNFIELVAASNNKVRAFVYNGVTQVDMDSTTTYSSGDTLKIALAYKANDFVLYVNGTQQATDTSGAIPASMEKITLNNYTVAGYDSANGYKQTLLFTSRLSNADLATLTA